MRPRQNVVTQLSSSPLASTLMNIPQRFKNKTNIGLVTNYVCTALLGKLFLTTIFMEKNTGNLIIGIIVLMNLVFLLISSRTLKKENIQSKISIIGKLFSLIFAVVFIVIVTKNTEYLFSIGNIFDTWISLMIIICVPYSFYLFRNKIDVIELPPQYDMTISAEQLKIPPQYETKITAEQLKMPPHAWGD